MSPYIHSEFSPSDKIRVTAGLRYDDLKYVYDNKMSDANISVNPTSTSFGLTYRHVSDTTVSFARLSPKVGMTYEFDKNMSGFLSYREAFRAPSEGQLFRSGRAINTADLKPIKVASLEAGLRGKSNTINYNVSLYYMSKKDDILTYKSGFTRETVNAGETLHEGVEVGMGSKLTQKLSLDIAASYAKHSYKEWNPETTVSYNGNEMEAAPRLIANTRFGYKAEALNGGKIEFEWVKLGDYWMDAANTYKYSGHDVINLRVNHFINKDFELFARVMNVADKRYATAASYSSSGLEYAPGMPRTGYVGMKYKF
jgi:outer membrane receptor protein involved in Fe transport